MCLLAVENAASIVMKPAGEVAGRGGWCDGLPQLCSSVTEHKMLKSRPRNDL